MKLYGLLQQGRAWAGQKLDWVRFQWQSTLTAHDPNPPITLENAAGPTTYNDTLAESVSAADAVVGAAVFPNSLAESGNAADGLVTICVWANLLAEPVVASDAVVTDGAPAQTQPGRGSRGAPIIIFHEGRRTFEVGLWEEAAAKDRIAARTAFGPVLVERARAETIYGTDQFAVLEETARAAFGLGARIVQRDWLAESGAARDEYSGVGAGRNGLREAGAAGVAQESQQVTQDGVAEAALADDRVAAAVIHGDEEEFIMAAMLLLGRRVSKAHTPQPLDRDRPIVNMMRVQLQQHVADFLRRLGHRIAAAARQVGKAAGDDPPRGAVAESDDADYSELSDAAKLRLREVAKDGAHRGLEQVRADVARLLAQTNRHAVAWADARAGELIVEIGDTTRARVRDLVRQAEEEGWSNDELADELAGDGVFGDARAEKIARTETADADVQGNLIGWKESGLVAQKEWITSKGNPCDDCTAKDGQTFDLDDPEGDPPEHPNCECDVLPVLSEDAAE